MKRTTSLALGAVGGLVGLVGAWNLYQRYTTETVPYTVVASVGDVELRRYPPTVLAETVADSRREAFGRLFRYIAGANEAETDLAMTAPVQVDGDGGDGGVSIPMTAPVEVSDGNRRIPMTAPVETDASADGVRMAFYLPAEYDAETAPRPTDEDVTLVAVPERTLAVRRFSWRATDRRVTNEVEKLEDALEDASVPLAGEPFYMGYDAPWTLPFLRRNEVAVEVESADAT
ncbi:SOUL family heme-binding protein [Halobaculum marinum]|uniref:SOUL family heme-binding protein n=1 Tax=Halobaculum marinum TaxID=3031996 RepID=A0ABD5X282_9EURY|nr:heme-binding protein [Halobaculum sp. DT55]